MEGNKTKSIRSLFNHIDRNFNRKVQIEVNL